MGWKLLYIVLAWPLIGAVELLALISRTSEWAHDRLVFAGVRLTKWIRTKVP
jgi:hypothetical protein